MAILQNTRAAHPGIGNPLARIPQNLRSEYARKTAIGVRRLPKYNISRCETVAHPDHARGLRCRKNMLRKIKHAAQKNDAGTGPASFDSDL